MSRRSLHWGNALASFKADRSKRAEVREELLRAGSSPGRPLSCWRGKSGRRYVCGILPADAKVLAAEGACVILAVRRPDIGPASIVLAIEDQPKAVAAWAMAAIDCGANELHVHRLAESEDERKAIVADLTS